MNADASAFSDLDLRRRTRLRLLAAYYGRAALGPSLSSPAGPRAHAQTTAEASMAPARFSLAAGKIAAWPRT